MWKKNKKDCFAFDSKRQEKRDWFSKRGKERRGIEKVVHHVSSRVWKQVRRRQINTHIYTINTQSQLTVDTWKVQSDTQTRQYDKGAKLENSRIYRVQKERQTDRKSGTVLNDWSRHQQPLLLLRLSIRQAKTQTLQNIRDRVPFVTSLSSLFSTSVLTDRFRLEIKLRNAALGSTHHAQTTTTGTIPSRIPTNYTYQSPALYRNTRGGIQGCSGRVKVKCRETIL